MSAIRTKRGAAILATAAAVMALGTFAGSSAQATTPSAAPTARSATSGIPGLVDPAVDLGRQPIGPEPTWFDSIYFTSTVKANGQEFGLQVHTRILPARGESAYRWTFAVINKTTGWYKDYDTMVKPADYRWSEGKLDIKAPGLTWTGGLTRQSVQVETPWRALDIQLEPTGPAMNYASTGLINLADGVPNYEFALPEMRTSGTLVVDVEPLAQGASQQWTSPATGQRCPTRWRIRIPALRSDLDVRVTGKPDQEIGTPDGSGYLEAAATFTGKYNGKKVHGENYVEMTGEWNS